MATKDLQEDAWEFVQTQNMKHTEGLSEPAISSQNM